MKSVTILILVLIGLLSTFGLAALTVFNYFVALFNDYQVLTTINEFGEHVYETPLIILLCPIMLFSTVFCVRLVIRIACVTNPSLKKRLDYNVRPRTDEAGFERLNKATDNPILEETPQVNT